MPRSWGIVEASRPQSRYRSRQVFTFARRTRRAANPGAQTKRGSRGFLGLVSGVGRQRPRPPVLRWRGGRWRTAGRCAVARFPPMTGSGGQRMAHRWARIADGRPLVDGEAAIAAAIEEIACVANWVGEYRRYMWTAVSVRADRNLIEVALDPDRARWQICRRRSGRPKRQPALGLRSRSHARATPGASTRWRQLRRRPALFGRCRAIMDDPFEGGSHRLRLRGRRAAAGDWSEIVFRREPRAADLATRARSRADDRRGGTNRGANRQASLAGPGIAATGRRVQWPSSGCRRTSTMHDFNPAGRCPAGRCSPNASSSSRSREQPMPGP